jgi:hypothetical protein
VGGGRVFDATARFVDPNRFGTALELDAPSSQDWPDYRDEVAPTFMNGWPSVMKG